MKEKQNKKDGFRLNISPISNFPYMQWSRKLTKKEVKVLEEKGYEVWNGAMAFLTK